MTLAERQAFEEAEAASNVGTATHRQKQLLVMRQAFHALARGEAAAGQQRLAWAHILNICGLADFDDPDAAEGKAAFTRGKRSVGMTLTWLSRVPVVGTVTDTGEDVG